MLSSRHLSPGREGSGWKVLVVGSSECGYTPRLCKSLQHERRRKRDRQALDAPWARHVSDLMRGKIGLFGLVTLVNTAAAAGLHIEIPVAEAACTKWEADAEPPRSGWSARIPTVDMDPPNHWLTSVG